MSKNDINNIELNKDLLIYVVRDGYGDLSIAILKPVKYGPDDKDFHEEIFGMPYVRRELFKNLTFESGPKKFALTTDKCKALYKSYPMTLSVSNYDDNDIKLTIPCYWDYKRKTYGITFPKTLCQGTFAEDIAKDEIITVYFTNYK